jgi:hypothetical protein
MKAYSVGPDTNGLIVAICFAFNKEEAHFFRSTKCRLLAHFGRAYRVPSCPLLGVFLPRLPNLGAAVIDRYC